MSRQPRGCSRRPATALPFDHDERRDGLDLEALQQVGALLLRDADDLERAVVAPALQHLREEALDTPTMARQCRVEKHEPGCLLLESRCGHCHFAPPNRF